MSAPRPEDIADDVRNHFVYRMFDADGVCLYVGCTMRPAQRMRAHRNWPWGQQVAKFKVAGPYPFKVARRLERAAMLRDRPRYGQTPYRGSMVPADYRKVSA